MVPQPCTPQQIQHRQISTRTDINKLCCCAAMFHMLCLQNRRWFFYAGAIPFTLLRGTMTVKHLQFPTLDTHKKKRDLAPSTLAIPAMHSEASGAAISTYTMQLSPGQVAWLPARALSAISCLQGSFTVETVAGPLPLPPLRINAGEPPWTVTASQSAWLGLRPCNAHGARCMLHLHAATQRTVISRIANAVAQWTGWRTPE